MTVSAQQVALAIVTACNVVGVNPAEVFQPVKWAPKARLLAGIGLIEAGLATTKEASRLLVLAAPRALTPSGRVKWGLRDGHVSKVVAALGGRKPVEPVVDAPPQSKPAEACAMRPEAKTEPPRPAAKPKHLRNFRDDRDLAAEAGRRGGMASPARAPTVEAPPAGVIDIQGRALAREARPMIQMRRTDADRAVPKEIKTRVLLGDPKPGRTPWAAPADAEEKDRQYRLERLQNRLSFSHPPETVSAIMADQDPRTNKDRADWQGLGR